MKKSGLVLLTNGQTDGRTFVIVELISRLKKLEKFAKNEKEIQKSKIMKFCNSSENMVRLTIRHT